MSSGNSTTSPPPRQSSPYPAPFLVQHCNLLIRNVCEHARSLLARVIGGDAELLLGLTCKRWSCRPCASWKIRTLAVKTKLAAPNRLLTLTVDPSLYDSPRQAFERTAPYVPELMRALRVRFGEVEYLRVTELTKKGFPHYHLLIRSGYLPQPVIKALWGKYTGAKIVDIKQVDQKFAAYVYLTKYLTKLHVLEWTDRHVSYSHHFFLTPMPNDADRDQLGDYRIEQEHPFSWLAHNMLGQTIIQTAALAWILRTPEPDAFPPKADAF